MFLASGSFALSPRFPATTFRSHEEFQRFLANERTSLDAHYEFETSLATREPTVVRHGTCGLCLKPTLFTSSSVNGEVKTDGRRVPNWREEMRCGCEDALTNRQRAVIHLLQASGLMNWMQLLILGPPADADRRLASMVESTVRVTRFQQNLTRLGTQDAQSHMAVSHDYLQFVPPLAAALHGICDALLPGGRFVFTAPFHFNERHSTLMPTHAYGGTPHRFGWDLLEMMAAAGFRDAAAHLYWSEELGYLGSMNFIFRAIK